MSLGEGGSTSASMGALNAYRASYSSNLRRLELERLERERRRTHEVQLLRRLRSHEDDQVPVEQLRAEMQLGYIEFSNLVEDLQRKGFVVLDDQDANLSLVDELVAQVPPE